MTGLQEGEFQTESGTSDEAFSSVLPLSLKTVASNFTSVHRPDKEPNMDPETIL